jgi:hypothetical protein
VLSILTELVLSHEDAALVLGGLPDLLPRLFALMPTKELLDGSVSLAQVVVGWCRC